MNNPEYVQFVANGVEFKGWESITIDYSMKDAVRSFKVETTERPGEWNFAPGTPVQIYANGTLILDGYTNRFSPSINPSSHPISIAGRSKAQDAVDCAAIHPRGYEKNIDPKAMADKLNHYGVEITAEVPLEKVPMLQIYQGETMFEALERYLRPQSVTMKGTPAGFAMTNAKAAKIHFAVLTEGINILDGNAELSDDRRFSDYTVKGQARSGTKPEHLRIREEAKDGSVSRYRPRMIVAEGDTDKKRARARADHEKNRAQGESLKASITVQGWRDDAGTLWEPNWRVYVQAPIGLHLEQEMLIESVSLNQTATGGSKARLSLVDAKAYAGKGDSRSKSDKAWG